jgi:hypothetical protein
MALNYTCIDIIQGGRGATQTQEEESQNVLNVKSANNYNFYLGLLSNKIIKVKFSCTQISFFS